MPRMGLAGSAGVDMDAGNDRARGRSNLAGDGRQIMREWRKSAGFMFFWWWFTWMGWAEMCLHLRWNRLGVFFCYLAQLELPELEQD